MGQQVLSVLWGLPPVLCFSNRKSPQTFVEHFSNRRGCLQEVSCCACGAEACRGPRYPHPRDVPSRRGVAPFPRGGVETETPTLTSSVKWAASNVPTELASLQWNVLSSQGQLARLPSLHHLPWGQVATSGHLWEPTDLAWWGQALRQGLGNPEHLPVRTQLSGWPYFFFVTFPI